MDTQTQDGLRAGIIVDFWVEGKKIDSGVITSVDPATKTRGDRITIEPGIKFGFIGIQLYDKPGWRYLQPDPLDSTRLTFSHRGPIYEFTVKSI
jgi:hypothetical protein